MEILENIFTNCIRVRIPSRCEVTASLAQLKRKIFVAGRASLREAMQTVAFSSWPPPKPHHCPRESPRKALTF